MTARVELSVNDVPIRLGNFVASFIENTVAGMVASLKGVSAVDSLSLDISGDAVTLYVNGNVVATSAFVNKIIRSTVFGMLAVLEGVGDIDQVALNIDK